MSKGWIILKIVYEFLQRSNIKQKSFTLLISDLQINQFSERIKHHLFVTLKELEAWWVDGQRARGKEQMPFVCLYISISSDSLQFIELWTLHESNESFVWIFCHHRKKFLHNFCVTNIYVSIPKKIHIKFVVLESLSRNDLKRIWWISKNILELLDDTFLYFFLSNGRMIAKRWFLSDYRSSYDHGMILSWLLWSPVLYGGALSFKC